MDFFVHCNAQAYVLVSWKKDRDRTPSGRWQRERKEARTWREGTRVERNTGRPARRKTKQEIRASGQGRGRRGGDGDSVEGKPIHQLLSLSKEEKRSTYREREQ